MHSLYFHIPFCERKCLYCDFYSIESQSSLDAFIDSLIAEMGFQQGGGEVGTVFFGGGTPSLLSPKTFERILAAIHAHWRIDPSAEITVETNPGTVDKEKLAAYRSLGVNRLSIGIQSFDQRELEFLSRIHDASQAIRCFEDARAVGFDNVSIDLMYSLPGQTLEQWRRSLTRGLRLQPDHLSLYGLIVEEGTPLFRLVAEGRVNPNGAEPEADLYQMTMQEMSAAGFHHYEVSSYARSGKECRHNLAYWHHLDYDGFGPSAHSFERHSGQGGRRWGNIANVSSYILRISERRRPIAFEEHLEPLALAREAVFLGLRSDGIHPKQLQAETGFDITAGQRAVIDGLLEQGLLESVDDCYRLTDKGYLLCDEIACRLMP